MFQQPATNIVVLALALFGVAYAALVRRIRQRDPEHGYTAWLVVVGNAAIVIAYTLLVGLELGALLFTCMAAAGAPMVVEFGDWYLSRAERSRQQQDLADLLKDVDEEPMP